VHDILKEKYPGASFVWVGTKYGPERQLIKEANIPFVSFSAGKLRRYASFFNAADIFKIIIGFFEALKFVKKEKPDLCISCGGFVSVPLHWAAWFFRIPSWIHQQDVCVGLSNKIMAPAARVITTALQQNIKNFPGKKTIWLGNPVRRDILAGDNARAVEMFGLKSGLPVVFVTGGGTGSENINQFIAEAVQQLQDVCEIIHLTGKERPHETAEKIASQFNNYHTYHFFSNEMKDAYAAADIIVARGGFGTLTEIAALGKAAIIIPKPGHQEANVQFLALNGGIVLADERAGSGVQLASVIKDLLNNSEKRISLGNKLKSLMPLAKKEDILDIVEKIVHPVK